jgi:hypothetical protein
MRINRPSTGLLVGGLALFVALGGTAAAATGQLVNIADPTHATWVAHVDSGGAVKTKTYPNAATFSRSLQVQNIQDNAVPKVLLETSATLAIDRIQMTAEDTGSTSPWYGGIFYQPASSGGDCTGTLTRIAVEAAPVGTEHLDSFGNDPLVLKPAVAGNQWCLVTTLGPANQTTGGLAYVDVSGVIVSGTFTPANEIRFGRSALRRSPAGG